MYLKRISHTFLFILFCLSNGHTQIFLQLEKYNKTKVHKLATGSIFECKLKKYPDHWQSYTIDRIMPEENALIMNGEIFSLSDFSEVRIRNKWAKGLAVRLYQFAVVWFTYAGILAATGDYEIRTDTFIIGGTSITLGLLIEKIFGTKKFKIGKNARLRIIDLRLVVPDQ